MPTELSPSTKPAGEWTPQAPPGTRQRLLAWVRYGTPLFVLATGAVTQFVFWSLNSGDATRQVMSSWYILPTTAFVLVLWWLFLSGFRWRFRLLSVGVIAVAVAVFFGLYRVKEFSGDMVPRFEWRWQPSAEDRAAEYWHSRGESAPAGDGHTKDDLPVQKATLAVTSADWPQFQGPNRDGIARGARIRTDWTEHPPRLLWRHPVGAGWSSFAVVGRYAFTQEQRGTNEAVVCYDADTGQQVWSHLDEGTRFVSEMGGVGPRATPTVFDSRVYTLGATGVLNCLDPKTGARLWSANAVEDAGVRVLGYGMSGSPLVYDSFVVVNPGGRRTSITEEQTSGRALIAYNRITGQQAWAQGDYQAGYASPILATIDGVRQIVIFDGVGAAGHDAATGKQLWRSLKWTNSIYDNIAEPVVQPDGTVFLSSGYGTGCVLLDVKKSGSSWSADPRWQAPNRFKLKFNSGVYRDGCVYGLDEGILACFDLSAGKVRWKKGRYGFGQLLLLDDLLLVISEGGDAALVEVTPEASREIGRFHALEGKTWNHPAISGRRLYVRNAEEAACYDVGRLETAAR